MNNQKKKGGRPTLESLSIERIRIKITLTLYEGQDDDLIDWFDSIPKRQVANEIKTALRQGGMTTKKKDNEFGELIDDDLFANMLKAL